MPAKIPIFNEKDLNALIEQAIKNNGVLVAPKELNQMIINLAGVSICSKPRKDGRYQGYIVDKDGRHYVYGRSQNEVALKLKHYLQYGIPKKRRNGARSGFDGVPNTFNGFALYYFENFRKKKVAEKTYKVDIRRYNKYLLPYFKETPLKKITPKACQTLIDSITETGKGKTADEIYSLLSVILKTAIKHGLIKNNPLEVIFHIKHENKHGKALTIDEENKFKSALQGSPYCFALMLALYTGLRPNELKTAKIDGKFIVAVNSKRKHKRVEYKKIPISAKLAPFIDGSPFIIPNLDHLRKKVKEILPEHILYDLRTTFYSRCKECNISEYAISEYMGHSLGALGNAYTDLSDEFLIKEMQKFDY